MPGIIIPDPRGGLVWIHGEDPSGDPVKIQATASGILFVSFDGMLAAGEHMHGFSGVVSEEVENTNLTGGNEGLNASTVPTGEFWRVTNIHFRYVGTAPTAIKLAAIVDGEAIYIAEEYSITSGVRHCYSVNIYLSAADYLRVYVVGSTAGDDLYLGYCGTKQAV